MNHHVIGDAEVLNEVIVIEVHESVPVLADIPEDLIPGGPHVCFWRAFFSCFGNPLVPAVVGRALAIAVLHLVGHHGTALAVAGLGRTTADKLLRRSQENLEQ